MCPESLWDFAYFLNRDSTLEALADIAEPEDWGYQNTASSYRFPVLFNYLAYTYQRLNEEGKIVTTQTGGECAFNTGLVTASQEHIFALFTVNRNQDAQPWFFNKWARQSDRDLSAFDRLPDIASYYEDPKYLVYDSRKELQVNIDHIVADNRDRFPEPYRSMTDYQVVTFVKGAVDNAIERLKRNYKTAVPQYYRGRIQLLIPLCLTSPAKADLALAVEYGEYSYRASTCLTLDMAYNNARQVTRPDRDWLAP